MFAYLSSLTVFEDPRVLWNRLIQLIFVYFATTFQRDFFVFTSVRAENKSTKSISK